MAWADRDGDGTLNEQEFIDAIMADVSETARRISNVVEGMGLPETTISSTVLDKADQASGFRNSTIQTELGPCLVETPDSVTNL